MLRTRIITAVVLLALLLPTLFLASLSVFALVMALFSSAAMWEWARLAGFKSMAAVVWAVLWLATAAALLLLMQAGGAGSIANLRPILMAAALAWIALLAFCLPRANLPRFLAVPAVLAVLGFIVMFAAWLALLLARESGPGFLLSLLGIAWVADIAAYFGGRAFGRSKLAPRISPGKTWAGAYAALLAVLVYAWVCSALPGLSGTLLARIDQTYGMPAMLVSAVLLVTLSIMGDLFESLLKRHAGVKDSSGLLPGHGGVLDRVDALLPLLPIALLFMA
ncbi:Phosphatidate cytidylyltransferase [Thiomonas sp. X19]|nr:Phosphatidate cytidylyltransferase [Thiomonas sp. X19]